MFNPRLVAGCAIAFACAPRAEIPARDVCENLSDAACLLPWPSDRYLSESASTPTGWSMRLESGALPANSEGVRVDGRAFDRLDGFSPGTRIMAMFAAPPVLDDRVATIDTIERSLQLDHPTVILDLETGERIPHWVELDLQAEAPEQTIVYLQPARVLEENRGYAVAIRRLGVPISAAFEVIRDGGDDSAVPDLARRADRFEAMFSALERAGVPREELELAWQFHTASGENIRGDILGMRDDALMRLGPDGIGCTVTDVTDNFAGGAVPSWTSSAAFASFRRIRGTYTVPSYMDSPRPPARWVRGADGRPSFVANVEVPFAIVVPRSVASPPRPSRTMIYGHGLMSAGEPTITAVPFRRSFDALETIGVATDWAGMSRDDIPAVSDALADASKFVSVGERLAQGMINQMALIRSMKGGCRRIDALQVDGVSLVDPGQVVFAGGSQGGILGATLLALSPDIDRAVVMVNGAAFPLMMERSIDFRPFLPLMSVWYPNRLDRAVILPMLQGLWDVTDPVGWLPHLAHGAPGIAAKKLLSITVNNDAQVPNIASDYAMRSANVALLDQSVRRPWGFDIASAPSSGSAYLTVDLGDRPTPAGNVSATENDHGHSRVVESKAALRAIDGFLRPGGVIDPGCDGVCDPE